MSFFHQLAEMSGPQKLTLCIVGLVTVLYCVFAPIAALLAHIDSARDEVD